MIDIWLAWFLCAHVYLNVRVNGCLNVCLNMTGELESSVPYAMCFCLAHHAC